MNTLHSRRLYHTYDEIIAVLPIIPMFLTDLIYEGKKDVLDMAAVKPGLSQGSWSEIYEMRKLLIITIPDHTIHQYRHCPLKYIYKKYYDPSHLK